MKKIFLFRLPLSTFLSKTLRVNEITKSFPKNLSFGVEFKTAALATHAVHKLKLIRDQHWIVFSLHISAHEILIISESTILKFNLIIHTHYSYWFINTDCNEKLGRNRDWRVAMDNYICLHTVLTSNWYYSKYVHKPTRVNQNLKSYGVFFSAKMSPSYKVHSKNCWLALL